MSWFEEGQCLGFEKDNVLVLKKDNVLVLKKDNVLVLGRTMYWDQGTGVPGYQEDIRDQGTGVPGSELTTKKTNLINQTFAIVREVGG